MIKPYTDILVDAKKIDDVGGVVLDEAYAFPYSILVIGHCRHGKDTIAEYLAKEFDIKFSSSSMFCIKKFIADELGYQSAEACFEDRHLYKEHMKRLISEYNTPNKDRLSREILEENDMYVGMRKDDEYQASKALFDIIFYVDASERLGVEDSTLDIDIDYVNMHIIDNNESEEAACKQAKEILQKALDCPDFSL